MAACTVVTGKKWKTLVDKVVGKVRLMDQMVGSSWKYKDKEMKMMHLWL